MVSPVCPGAGFCICSVMEESPIFLLTGSHGLVGQAVCRSLREKGAVVRCLVRSDPDPARDRFRWDPATGEIQEGAGEGVVGIIHLAGENIADGRWSAAKKKRLWESRETATRRLAETVAGWSHPPAVWINASATGYYGDRGEEEVDENSTPGSGFLADLCVAWEKALEPIEKNGLTRVVRLRIGPVLAREGGVLGKVLPIFRLGGGGRIGHGKQFMPWIERGDLVRLITFALTSEALAGAVNAVAPETIRNATFAETLGRLLHRPALLPAPAFALRLRFGEMADEMLLSGAKVVSRKLADAGFSFTCPTLEKGLHQALKEE